MLTSRLSSLLVTGVASCLLLGACSDDDDGTVITDSSLVVDNQSDFSIVELHLTDVGSPTWGPNLLSGDELLPGDQLTLGVDCGRYDALLVDEDGVDCEVDDLDLCLNDAVWVIHNNTCAVFGAARVASGK